ncbi:MAG: phosphoribosyltransferase family protein [Bacteroidota bacterium]
MDHSEQKVKILGATAVDAKLRRIAYEIYERSFGREEIVIIGIGKRGGYVADRLEGMLAEVAPLKVLRLAAVKAAEGDGITLDGDDVAGTIQGRLALVVDDVLYSGRTMFHALAAVMEHGPEMVQTAVLIDRGHRNLPVTHDYVGMVLATSLKQYVSVEIAENEKKAVAYVF